MKTQINEAATTSQIETEKPNVPKSKDIPYYGDFSGSTNGGIARPVYYKRIMKNELHKKVILDFYVQTLTPKTPVFDPLQGVIDVYWVPDSEVWTNADEFYAQRGGSTVEKIAEMPNFGGKRLDWIGDEQGREYTCITNTEQWKDSWISTYIARVGPSYNIPGTIPNINTNIMPKHNALVARGYPVIRNNFIRNKEFESEMYEYKDDTVSDEEWESYMPNKISYGTHTKTWAQIFSRNKKPNSYYTNFRTDLQGFQIEKPEGTKDELLEWAQWENLIDVARSSAEYAQMRDVEILARLRGGPVADILHKARHIARKEISINYSAITQSTYNNSPDVQDKEFNAMGKQGAYSFTHVQMPLYEGEGFLEEGTIHVFFSTYADTSFEKGIDRQMLNVSALDIYRPDNAQKNDVMYELETSTEDLDQGAAQAMKIKGFKRKFNELFKGNRVIQGDMTSMPHCAMYYIDGGGVGVGSIKNGEIIPTNGTYQFHETDEYFFNTYGENMQGDVPYAYVTKEHWLDYTDLLINKNLAFKRPILTDSLTGDGKQNIIKVSGMNQLTYKGSLLFLMDLPVPEEIKNDYTTWGEH